MVTTIRRWGKSLAVRIPKAIVTQAQLTENSHVDISIEGSRIIVTAARREWKLDDLLKTVRPSKMHREVRWRDRTGKES